MAQEHIQLPFLGVNYVQYHGGSYIDGVNMEWSDTQRRLCLGACILVVAGVNDSNYWSVDLGVTAQEHLQLC